jgi:hypothetical protein
MNALLRFYGCTFDFEGQPALPNIGRGELFASSFLIIFAHAYDKADRDVILHSCCIASIFLALCMQENDAFIVEGV